MSLRRALAYFVILCVCTGCVSQTEAAVDLAAEEQAVRALSMQWLELDRAKNPAAIAALFASDGTLFRENRDPIVGAAAIEARITQNFADNPSVVTTWSTDRVEVAASGELAIEYGTWSSSGLGADGTGSDSGKYVTTYRKVDGVWRIVGDISLSTQPEAAPATP